MKNDMQRAVDSVLSGLTTTPEMQEQLIRTAMKDSQGHSLRHGARVAESSRKAGERANRVKFKLNLSLSFGLPHMIVAAIVVIVVMIAPLFVPGTRTIFDTWQSEDGEYYMVQGNGKVNNEQAAVADFWPTEEGVFDCKTLEEAYEHFGGKIPVITWLPEGWSVSLYTVSSAEWMRAFNASYQRGEKERIAYSVFESREGLSYTYVEQDEEGEFVTLSDGREVYVTTNMGWQSIAWMENDMQIVLSGSLTREEAIRMAESVKIP